jgi:hypothetical protein
MDIVVDLSKALSGDGWQRTTKGIWADVHRRRSDGLPMVILDMEGNLEGWF